MMTSSSVEARRIYDRALEYGYVNYRSSVCLLTGVAGSGKTSVKHLLFDMPPPIIRESTPLAEAPIRTLACVRVDATDDEEWKILNDREHSKGVASEMVVQSKRKMLSVSVTTTSGDTATNSTGAPVQRGVSATSQSGNKEARLVEGSDGLSQASSLTQPSSQVKDEIIGLISSASTPSDRPENIDMIYLVDSGGQPQFQDILALFLGWARMMIFVTPLSQKLDNHPPIGYYEQGKAISKPQPSFLSHLEVLLHSAQALQSQACAQQENLDKEGASNLLIVGTHRDWEWTCLGESRSEKNQKLTTLLSPTLQDHLVFYGEDTKEVIFPMNAKKPKAADRRVAGEIRKAIRRASSSIERVKTPFKWHVLEMTMGRVASDLGRAILTREECLQIARNLRMSEEEFDAALDHLTRLHVIFYFRSVLPDLIFVRPQALLDKLTEIVQRRYQLCNYPDKSVSTEGGRMVRFRDEGLVTIQFLADFPKHYSEVFTPAHLVRLLLHRLVIAEAGNDEYFIPFILPHLSPAEVDKHRVQLSSTAAPLAITFPGSVVPSGLFPAVAASLLSSRDDDALELLPSSARRGHPECVYRNCIKFKLPGGGSLTLIDAFTHIEAHVNALPRVCSKHCPAVKEAILFHVKAASSAMRFHNLSPRANVLCESAVSHGETSTRTFWQRLRRLFGPQSGRFRHHADVFLNTSSWACSLAPEIHGELTERHLLWFPAERTQGLPPTSKAEPPQKPSATHTESSDQCPGVSDTPQSAQEDGTPVIHDAANERDQMPREPHITQTKDQHPNMTEVLKFPGEDGPINIPQEIGVKFRMFGIFLLEDTNGSTVEALAHQHRENPEAINMAVLREWLQGKGRQPVTWQTLVGILRDCELNTLADDIAAVKVCSKFNN